MGNLLCGALAVWAASAGRLDLMLGLVLLGFALDGPVARRWGGTRLGVYADDVADAVTYGLAPGAAIYFALGGAQGLLLGAGYALFTWTRLVYFTLTKHSQEPGHFGGVPSAVSAVLVVCALLVLGGHALYLGASIGIACVLMVAFPMRYLHASRLVRDRNARPVIALGGLIAVGATALVGVQGLAIALLCGALAYGLWPSLTALRAAVDPGA